MAKSLEYCCILLESPGIIRRQREIVFHIICVGIDLVSCEALLIGPLFYFLPAIFCHIAKMPTLRNGYLI